MLARLGAAVVGTVSLVAAPPASEAGAEAPAGAHSREPESKAASDEGLSAAPAIARTVGHLDALIANLDEGIRATWAEAETVLVRADAAAGAGEQARLEALYGKIAAMAEGLEKQRRTLRELRDELAAVGGRIQP